MINLKPYQDYDEPMDPWIGKLPIHWQRRRLRTVAEMRVSNVDKNRIDGELPIRLCNYNDVYKNSKITAAIPFMKATATPDEIEYFRLKLNDVIITKDSETWNDIGVPSLVQYAAPELVCGYHLALLRPRSSIMFGPYLFRALQSQGVASQLHIAANGVTRFGLSHGDIKSVVVPVPPPEEQAAIARFLDHVDQLIKHYIHAKQQSIKLLQEQAQTIIQRTVTQGLEPGVRHKASGLSWLRSVPEHWTVTQLKRYWRVIDCKHLTVPFFDEGIPLASVREVQSFDLNFASANKTTHTWYELLIEGGRQPQRGDLIYCRNVSVGACAYIDTDENFAMGQDVCLIRSAAQNQRYLNYLLHSQFMQEQLSQLLIGSTFNRINVADVKSLVVLVPPRQEQDTIASYLDSRLQDTLAPTSRIHHEISLIREYRTRLIVDVVTGKLDVREVAANLPEEAGEPQDLLPADEALTSGDGADLLPDDPAEEEVTV